MWARVASCISNFRLQYYSWFMKSFIGNFFYFLNVLVISGGLSATLTFHLRESPRTLPAARWWRPRGPGRRHNRRPCTAGAPYHRAATQVARWVFWKSASVLRARGRQRLVIAPRKLLPRRWRSLAGFRATIVHSRAASAAEWKSAKRKLLDEPRDFYCTRTRDNCIDKWRKDSWNSLWQKNSRSK